MKFDQYYDRTTTPLKWHKFSLVCNIIMAVLFAFIGVAAAIGANNPEVQETLGMSLEMNGIPVTDIGEYSGFVVAAGIVFIIVAALEIVVFVLGKKFKMIYIYLTAAGIVLNILSSLVTLFGDFTGSNLISFVLTAVICGCIGIYYYKRMPLFAKDYDEILAQRNGENTEEINYDQLNQQQ